MNSIFDYLDCFMPDGCLKPECSMMMLMREVIKELPKHEEELNFGKYLMELNVIVTELGYLSSKAKRDEFEGICTQLAGKVYKFELVTDEETDE